MLPEHFTRVVASEEAGRIESRRWELNPTTPVWRTGVSPQHFTCLAVSVETWLWTTVGAAGAVRWPCVPPSGIEPEPLGLQPSAQTNCAKVDNGAVAPDAWGPTPWDRTRTSRVSAERADPLRQGGKACRARNDPRARHVTSCWVPAKAPSSSSLFGFQRSPAARAGRTSGRDAIAESANTPFACSLIWIASPDRESQNQIVVSLGRSRPETKKGRLVSLAALQRGGVTGVTSSAWGSSREDATVGATVISPKLRGFCREQRRRGTDISPAPHWGGGGLLPGLTVM